MNAIPQPPSSVLNRPRRNTLVSMTQGLGVSAPPRISIRAQRFTLIDSNGVQQPVQLFDQQLGPYLDVVIIGANPKTSKIYYEGPYDPNNDEPPTCFSDNGIGPSSQSQVPQNATCQGCPNNVWGSDTSAMTGKPTKACSDRKKLALLVVGHPARMAWMMVVPPASLKNLRGYAEVLKQHQVQDAEGMRPCDPADVITRIYFNPQKQGELLFAGMGFVDDSLVQLTAEADASGVIDTLIGTNDVPFQGALAAPAPQQVLPPPARPNVVQLPSPPPQQPAAFQTPPVGAPPVAANGGGGTPPPPAPRGRRGGPRQGAGRPAQVEQAPQPAPFGAAPAVPQQPMPATAPAASSPPFSPPAPGQFQMRAAPPAEPPPAAPAAQHPGVPPFLQRPAAAPAPAPRMPVEQNPTTFGMTNTAPPPPADVSEQLKAAFGAPMQPRPRG